LNYMLGLPSCKDIVVRVIEAWLKTRARIWIKINLRVSY